MDVSAISTTRCSATLVLWSDICNHRGSASCDIGVSGVTGVTFSQVKALMRTKPENTHGVSELKRCVARDLAHGQIRKTLNKQMIRDRVKT